MIYKRIANLKKSSVKLIEIADKAKVSRNVVAHVLIGTGGKNTRCSKETAQRVKQIADRLGYRPNKIAQQLRGAPSKLIGVFSPPSPSLFQTDNLNSLEIEAAAHGYHTIIGRIYGNEEKTIACINEFLDRGVDGIVFLQPLSDKDKKLKEVLRDIEILLLYNETEMEKTISFHVDKADGVRQLVKHLVAQGYQRIGLTLSNRKIDSMRERIDGYIKGLSENNIPLDKQLIWSAEIFETLSPFAQKNKLIARNAVEHLFFKHNVDAIIASNDIMAVYFIKELKKHQIAIPKDVGIAGFNNSIISVLADPEITSIDQHNSIIAEKVMEIFLKKISGSIVHNKKIVITPSIVIRNSTLKKDK